MGDLPLRRRHQRRVRHLPDQLPGHDWSSTARPPNASDAGIYVGKCGWLEDETTPGGVVHHNIAVNGNVAGLEVENCLGVVDVYENLVIDNTGGLMPLQQPGASSPTRPARTPRC